MDSFSKQLIDAQNAMKQHALFLTHDPVISQDLTQETTYIALKYKDKYIEQYKFQSWVLTVMNNLYINIVKNKARQITSSKPIDYIVETQINDSASILQYLPNNIRRTFQMLVEGYKYKDISEVLNLPIGTVKYHIHEARKILKNKLYSQTN